MRENIGFTDTLHRKIVMKLLRNLRTAKNDPYLDERKWMNPELLTIQVPQHMVAKIQAQMNSLYDDPSLISDEKQNINRYSEDEQRHGRNGRLNNTNSSRKFGKVKKKKLKPQTDNFDNAILEEKAIYQIASDSVKKDRLKMLENKLDEYRVVNEQLAKENEQLKLRLNQYEDQNKVDSL